jgi:hypothetical protein
MHTIEAFLRVFSDKDRAFHCLLHHTTDGLTKRLDLLELIDVVHEAVHVCHSGDQRTYSVVPFFLSLDDLMTYENINLQLRIQCQQRTVFEKDKIRQAAFA